MKRDIMNVRTGGIVCASVLSFGSPVCGTDGAAAETLLKDSKHLKRHSIDRTFGIAHGGPEGPMSFDTHLSRAPAALLEADRRDQ